MNGIIRLDRLTIFVAESLGHCFGIIPAPGSFAGSAFPVPPYKSFETAPKVLCPSQKAAARFGSSIHSLSGCPNYKGRNGAEVMHIYVKWNRISRWFARPRLSH